MSVLFGRLTVAALLSITVVAQAPGPAASFDAADVFVRPHSWTRMRAHMTGGTLRGRRYDIQNATMLDLISAAYAVDGRTVLGGPNWLDRSRFDIVAKAPESTPRETLHLMLQSLLADRFKLVLHKDTKPVPTYLLAVSGTPKLKAGTAPTEDAAKKPPCQPAHTPSSQTSTGVPFSVVSCHGATMPQFAEQLQNFGGQYIDTRVVDQTGLKGNWDFDLKWTTRADLSRAGSEGLTLTEALEQLGLKVTYDNAPASVLVVDRVLEMPTANPSGAAENLPAPPPAEIDVADITIAAPDSQMSYRFEPNALVDIRRADIHGVTMRALFERVWNITDDDLLAGAPGWFDSTKYNLVATVSSVSSDQNGVQFDWDDFRAMLRALLIKRFKIVTHTELRPVDAYTLMVADKPRLQAADPANRTKWFEGVLPGVKDPRDANPMWTRVVTVQNMTMAQFAEDLSSIDPGDLSKPVVDATGISGAWDFGLSYTGNLVNGRGALSLFDALPKELGLKLEQHKRPLPVLVIDHIEREPTDR
jgi:uncharacterized protein (TIGR03435 family)